MKIEQLQPGQEALALGAAPQSAELNAGGQASHEANTRGGSAMYLRGLAEGEHGTSQFGAAPQVEHAGGQAEMGGGGDAIEDWVAKKGGYEKLLQQIQQNGWADNMVWPLDDGTKLSVAEVKRRAAAAASPPPPEQKNTRANKFPENLPSIASGASRKDTMRKHWEKQIARADVTFEDLMAWREEIQKARGEMFDESGWSAWVRAYDKNEVQADRLLLDVDKEILRRVMNDQGVTYGEELMDERKLTKLRSEHPHLVEPTLKALLEEFRKADMLSELPIGEEGGRDILSPRVDFRTAFNRLLSLMRRQNIQQNGVGEQDEGKILEQLEKIAPADRVAELKRLMSEQQRYAAVAAEIGMEPDILSMGGAMRDLAAYVFEPEIDKALRLAEELNQDQRNQWVARLTGGMLRAGRAAARAGIYLSALGGDEDASSIESAIAKGQALVERIIGLAGYLKPDQLHQGAGFFKSEEISALLECPIRFAAWIKDSEHGETKKRIIEIAPKDVLATFYNTEVMRELLANQAMGERGYWTARGKWFKFTFWRRAGYSQEDSLAFVTGKKDVPEVVMTNQLAMTTRRNINSLDRWLGENWWMLMEAEATFLMSRSDYGMLPIDEFVRRMFLGLRGVEQADYTRLYDLGDPFLQQFGGIAYLGEYFSLTAKETLFKPLADETKVNADGSRLRLQDDGDRKVWDLRKKALERLIFIDQSSPTMLKELAKMTLGIGEYCPAGTTPQDKINEWKKKVTRGMRVIDRTSIDRLRFPEFWKDATAAHLGLKDEQIAQAWENFDFSSWLKQEGLSNEEIAARPTRGVAGWERFKENASLRLMRFKNAHQRDYDKSFRYLVKVAATQEAIEKLFFLNLESADLRTAQLGTTTTLSGGEAGLHILSRYTTFEKELMKAGEELIAGDFIPSDDSQRLYRDLLKGYRDTHCGWDLDRVYVEAVEADKAGIGTTFSVRRLDEQAFQKSWQQMGVNQSLIEQQIKPFLNGWQLYFVESVEMEADRKAEEELPQDMRKTHPILVGPNTGFIPDVLTPRQLLSELRQEAKGRLGKMKGELGGDAPRSSDYRSLTTFLNELGELEKEGGFCWARLRDGAWSLPPEAIAALVAAVDKKANLSTSVSAVVIEDSQRLLEQGLLKDHIIADGGWRQKITRPGLLNRLYWLGAPSAKTDVKTWRKR